MRSLPSPPSMRSAVAVPAEYRWPQFRIMIALIAPHDLRFVWEKFDRKLFFNRVQRIGLIVFNRAFFRVVPVQPERQHQKIIVLMRCTAEIDGGRRDARESPSAQGLNLPALPSNAVIGGFLRRRLEEAGQIDHFDTLRAAHGRHRGRGPSHG